MKQQIIWQINHFLLFWPNNNLPNVLLLCNIMEHTSKLSCEFRQKGKTPKEESHS